jgi:Domain of unknown function (DUF6933)
VILRCTAKVLALVGVSARDLADVPPSDDDWYVNLLWIQRRKCLLLTHAGTLFPVFVGDVRKADIRPIGSYVVGLVEDHLRIEGLAPDALGQLDAEDVQLAKTASRSILGVMNDAAVHARYRIEAMGGIDRSDAVFLNRYLRRTLHNRDGDYVTPLDLVAERLRPHMEGLPEGAARERIRTSQFGSRPYPWK